MSRREIRIYNESLVNLINRSTIGIDYKAALRQSTKIILRAVERTELGI